MVAPGQTESGAAGSWGCCSTAVNSSSWKRPARVSRCRRRSGGVLLVVICSFFFISFKGISFKKAALIRNLPGQNEITPQLRVAKSSGITGDSEAAACTISLSSHTSFYLIYLAPYRPFSSPALTICALYPSSTYSSTHIQLYLPSHHYKYPIHPSLPISLSSARPLPYPPSDIYIYVPTHTCTHTHPRLSICHQQRSPLCPFSPPSLTARILLSAGSSIITGALLCWIYYARARDICHLSPDPCPSKQQVPPLPCYGRAGEGMPWGELLDTVLGASQRDLVMGWMRSSRGAEPAGLSGMCMAVPRACVGRRKGQAPPALSRNKPLQSLKHGQQLRTSPRAVSSARFRKVLSTLCQHLTITTAKF